MKRYREVQVPQMAGRQDENVRVGPLFAIAGRETVLQPSANLRQME